MAIAHSLAIPALLSDSDMFAIVPSPLARAFERQGELYSAPTPYVAPSSSITAVWHTRNEHDAALQWLRAQLIDVAADIPR